MTSKPAGQAEPAVDNPMRAAPGVKKPGAAPGSNEKRAIPIPDVLPQGAERAWCGAGTPPRAGDITLLTAPLWTLDPDERVWDEDDEDEDS